MLALVAVMICGSLVVLTMAYVNADRQRRLAEHREAGERASAEFYESYVLAAARPQGYWGGLGKDATLKEALDHAAPKIDEVFADQPELEAEVRSMLGMTYFHVGQFDAANPHLEQAYAIRRARLGPDDSHTLRSLHELAMLRWKQGNFDEAVALGRQALDGRRRVLGRKHEDALWTQLNLGLFLMSNAELDEAERLARQALDIRSRVLGDGHEETIWSKEDLAKVLQERVESGNTASLAEAEQLYQQVFAYCREHSLPRDGWLVHALADFGQLLIRVGRGPEAETFLREFLAMIEGRFPERKAAAAGLRSVLGWVLVQQKRFDEAEPLLTDSYLELAQSPKTTPKVRAAALDRVVTLYEQWGKPDQASTWRLKR